MADDVPILSAEEQAELAADHHPDPTAPGFCVFCEDSCGHQIPWPCEIARYLATITALERERDAADARAERFDAVLRSARWDLGAGEPEDAEELISRALDAIAGEAKHA